MKNNILNEFKKIKIKKIFLDKKAKILFPMVLIATLTISIYCPISYYNMMRLDLDDKANSNHLQRDKSEESILEELFILKGLSCYSNIEEIKISEDDLLVRCSFVDKELFFEGIESIKKENNISKFWIDDIDNEVTQNFIQIRVELR